MSKFNVEDYASLCALTYFDINDYQKGMSLFNYLEECLRKTDSTSVFFKKMKDFVEIQDFSKFIDLKVIDYVNENQSTGLVYYRFEDDDNCYLIYRGSELYDPCKYENGWQDWFDNLEIFLGITHQQLKAHKQFLALESNKRIHLIGHSKGGNIVLFLGVTCNDLIQSKIDKIYTFNAPGMSQDLMEMYEKRIKDTHFLNKITCIENEMDPVSSMFMHLKSPTYISSMYKQNKLSDAYESHQIWGFEKINHTFVTRKTKGILPKLIDIMTNQFMNQLDKKNKKKIIHTLMYVCKDEKTIKMIQDKIESWVKKIEKIE